MSRPFHAQMIVTVEINGDVNFHMEGCEQCLTFALAAGYELNDKFRSLMRNSFKQSTENLDVRITKLGDLFGIKQHWN